MTRVVGIVGMSYLLVVAILAIARPKRQTSGAGILPIPWEHPIGVAGLGLLVTGNLFGLFMAPKERFMGDVGRILYVHVPAAWIAMVCFLLGTVFAVGFLYSGKRAWDSAMEAACEVGVLEGVLLLLLGSIFARPTWGVWWSWDPRLTSTAVMTLSFVGVLLLRGIVREPDQRATRSAIATVLAGVNVPIVYMSVKWWASLHQMQSEGMKGSTIDDSMRWILYFNTWALLYVTVWFLAQRWRLAEARAAAESPDPLPEVAT
ncbi:MAG: cytochrome c biogenesis protein CcsA [Myxococcota bacterium]